MIIQSSIKFCFWFSDILDMVDSKFHKVYHQFTRTVKVMENICFLCYTSFKRLCRTYLLQKLANFEKHLVKNEFFSSSIFLLVFHLEYSCILVGHTGFCSFKKSRFILFICFLFGVLLSFKTLSSFYALVYFLFCLFPFN